eukprot:GHVQ01004972.1.p1 GENE.GHVQ01004972.1~~GHVQ01004972.1.p1  ORF type:complete len:444 (+),score=52.15 GHVQ01004972.1:290-1621(+)
MKGNIRVCKAVEGFSADIEGQHTASRRRASHGLICWNSLTSFLSTPMTEFVVMLSLGCLLIFLSTCTQRVMGMNESSVELAGIIPIGADPPSLYGNASQSYMETGRRRRRRSRGGGRRNRKRDRRQSHDIAEQDTPRRRGLFHHMLSRGRSAVESPDIDEPDAPAPASHGSVSYPRRSRSPRLRRINIFNRDSPSTTEDVDDDDDEQQTQGHSKLSIRISNALYAIGQGTQGSLWQLHPYKKDAVHVFKSACSLVGAILTLWHESQDDDDLFEQFIKKFRHLTDKRKLRGKTKKAIKGCAHELKEQSGFFKKGQWSTLYSLSAAINNQHYKSRHSKKLCTFDNIGHCIKKSSRPHSSEQLCNIFFISKGRFESFTRQATQAALSRRVSDKFCVSGESKQNEGSKGPFQPELNILYEVFQLALQTSLPTNMNDLVNIWKQQLGI